MTTANMATVCGCLRAAAFPIHVTSGVITVTVAPDVFAAVGRDLDVTLWDTRGTDFADVLRDAEAAVPDSVESHRRPAEVLLRVQAALEPVAGFDGMNDDAAELADLPDYDSSADALVFELRGKVDVFRPLKITTYGTRFVFEPPAGVEAVYDVSTLRGTRNKFTQRLRGTDAKLLFTVRSIPEFEATVRRITTEIEAKGLSHVAVICRAGHHRSVAVAEWLKHVYTAGSTEHMTIHM
jgi:hypothetical protein